MQTPFKNKQAESEFINKGFTTFPFLETSEIDFVREIYADLNGAEKRLEQRQFYGVNYSVSALSLSESKKPFELILEKLKAKLSGHFNSFEILGCLFITKPAKTFDTFVYHQDWSYTDETKHAFATCWIPLYDSNNANGGMSIIPHSHWYFKTYRSASLDSSRIEFEKIPDNLKENIALKAGSCLAFHQAAFHGSFPNTSNESRPILAFIVKHIESPIIYYDNNNGEVNGHELAANDFNKLLEQLPNVNIPDTAILRHPKIVLPELPTAKDIIAKSSLENSL